MIRVVTAVVQDGAQRYGARVGGEGVFYHYTVYLFYFQLTHISLPPELVVT